MKTWQNILLGLVLGLMGSAVVWLISSPPRGDPIVLHPPPTPLPLMVHVSGAVQAPGVYALPRGARVQDAIEAAGGFTEGANVDAVNLAAFLEDGGKVVVPEKGEQVESAKDYGNSSQTPSSESLVDINTADQATLETLPGIGPVMAQRIIEYRDQNGFFNTKEDIMNVKGIGEATYTQIRDLIVVNP